MESNRVQTAPRPVKGKRRVFPANVMATYKRKDEGGFVPHTIYKTVPQNGSKIRIKTIKLIEEKWG